MLNFEGLGDAVAEKLVEGGIIRNPLDIFKLSSEDFADLHLAPARLQSGEESKPRRFGEKKASVEAKVKCRKDLVMCQRLSRISRHRSWKVAKRRAF